MCQVGTKFYFCIFDIFSKYSISIFNNDTQIIVIVSINDGTPKQYTFNYDEEIKVDGIKNKIAITKGDDEDQFEINYR